MFRQLAPDLIGLDLTSIGAVNEVMDYSLKVKTENTDYVWEHYDRQFSLQGHPYVKSPIDMACWDALGKLSGLPVSSLLGGAKQESVKLYRAMPQREPREMAALAAKYKKQGYRRIQLKLGGEPREDVERFKRCREVLDETDVLIGDGNTGWSSADALRVAKAVGGMDVYMEQPCRTNAECR